MRLVFFLARRNLLESPLGMILLIGAVAAGVGFQIPNTANQAGYHQELVRHGISSGWGDVRVRPRVGKRFDDAGPLVDQLARHEGVRAALPVLLTAGAVKSHGRYLDAPIVGVDTRAAHRPFNLAAGEPLAEGDAGGVLLGTSIADELEAKVGDTIVVRVFLSSGSLDDDLGRYELKVRGLVDGAVASHASVFVDWSFLAREAAAPRAASAILLYADNHDGARALADQIEAAFPEVRARSWSEENSFLASAIHANGAIAAVSQTMVVVAVAIPVLALLYINVLGRRRDIGLLAAMGFGARTIFAVFMTQALALGVVGSALGCCVGYGLCRFFQAHPIFEWQGFVVRPVLSLSSFAQPVGIVLAAVLVAGVYPALRAARLDPAPVFRGIS
jgi:lipoprotein-releasing system permease protein